MSTVNPLLALAPGIGTTSIGPGTGTERQAQTSGTSITSSTRQPGRGHQEPIRHLSLPSHFSGPSCPNHQPGTYPPPRLHSEWPTPSPRPLALSLSAHHFTASLIVRRGGDGKRGLGWSSTTNRFPIRASLSQYHRLPVLLCTALLPIPKNGSARQGPPFLNTLTLWSIAARRPWGVHRVVSGG